MGTDPAEHIRQLAQGRNRAGKEPLTREEILAGWYRIRDGAQAWAEQCVVMGSSKGSNSALELYGRAIIEIERIETRAGASTGNAIIIAGFDPAALETGVEQVEA